MSTAAWKLRLVGPFVAVLLVVGACTSQPTTQVQPPSAQDQLRIAVASFGTESLDPQRSPNFNGFYVGLIFDPLVGINKEGNDISKETGVAQDWTVTPDQMTYTFTLRQGVTFHNGDKLTADDVKFTLDRLADKETISTYGKVLAGGFSSVRVVDPYTVQIQLKQPAATLLMMLSPLLDTSGLIVPKSYFDKVGVAGFAQAPIGSGPYRLVERKSGNFLSYERASESHFAYGKTPFKSIRISMVPEEGTRRAMLQAKDVDFIDVGIDGARDLGSKGFQTFQSEGSDSLTLNFQLQRDGEITRDINLRKALSLAIDREQINKSLFGGDARVTGNLMMGQLGGKPIKADSYDPEGAKKFLASSSYDPKAPIALNVQAMNFVGWPQMLETAAALQAYWKAVGITTEITYRELGAFLAEWGAPGKLPKNVIVMNVLFGRPDFAGNTAALFGCAGTRVSVCDPKLDAMTAQWLASKSPDEYRQQAAVVEQYMVDNYYAFTLLAKPKIFSANAAVRATYKAGSMAGTFHIRGLIWPN